MIKKIFSFTFFCLVSLAFSPSVLADHRVTVFPNNVTNELINGNPIGFNLGWFMTREKDMLEPIKTMNLGVLRFPFGHMADNYLWDVPPWPKSKGDGITPKIASQSRVPALGTAPWTKHYLKSKDEFHSEMDIDEYMSLIRKTGTTPLISVNYIAQYYSGGPSKAQLIETAKEWVRYANVTNDYQIKYWSIGNEVDHHTKFGYTKEDYVKDFKVFAKAMKQVDPTIKVGAAANGWFQFLTRELNEEADYIAAHQYGRQHEDYAYYRDYTSNLVKSIWRANHAVRKNPKKNGKKWEVVVSEYGGFFAGMKEGSEDNNDLWKALLTADMTGTIINRPHVSLSSTWAARSPYGDPSIANNSRNYLGPNYEITPFGYALKLFGRNMQDKMIRTVSTSKKIRAYSAKNNAQNEITVWLINKGQSKETVSISIDGHTLIDCNSTDWVTGDGDPWATLPKVTYQKKSCLDVKDNEYQAIMPPVSMAAIRLSTRTQKSHIEKAEKTSVGKRDTKYLVHKPTGFKFGACDAQIGAPVLAESPATTGACVTWIQVKNNGVYLIHHAQSGLSIRPQTSADDAPIVLASSSLRNNWIQWYFDSRDNGFGHLVNRQTGKHVFVAQDNEGGQITQVPSSWRGDYTQWKFVPINPYQAE